MTARIAPAAPPWPDRVAKALAPLTPEGTEPLVLFRTLARDERLFGRFMGGGLLDPGHLALAEREIVIHRVCALNRAEYEWGVHAAVFARAAGLAGERLAATVHGNASSPCWTPKEAVLIWFCDAVNARADIDDDLWAALGEHFSELARLELMLLAGFYRTVSLLVNGLRLPMEPGSVAFPR